MNEWMNEWMKKIKEKILSKQEKYHKRRNFKFHEWIYKIIEKRKFSDNVITNKIRILNQDKLKSWILKNFEAGIQNAFEKIIQYFGN